MHDACNLVLVPPRPPGVQRQDIGVGSYFVYAMDLKQSHVEGHGLNQMREPPTHLPLALHKKSNTYTSNVCVTYYVLFIHVLAQATWANSIPLLLLRLPPTQPYRKTCDVQNKVLIARTGEG